VNVGQSTGFKNAGENNIGSSLVVNVLFSCDLNV
jgi:hypothetical protein